MLIILSTHPIQYQIPLWKKMTEAGIDLEVWYFTDYGINRSFDPEFGKSFSWDIPMLEGYKYRFLKTNKGASPNEGFRNCRLQENIKKKLIESKAQYVYINGWQVMAYWQALWSAKSLGLITIFKGESNDLKPENKFKWPIKRALLSQFFKKVDYLLYIGQANKRLYKRYGIPESKLLPGLYCIENERFFKQSNQLKLKKDDLRKTWGIAKESFCILFSGKFIPKKRPLDIIFAVKQLLKNKSITNIHLLFVGDGELYDQIKSVSNVVYDKEHGLTNSVNPTEINTSIIGFLNQTEIPKAYVVSDCLILPSDYGETWGLVVNEALSSGIPAIVSDQCGSAEDLILPIDKKLIFETGNIESLAKSIVHQIKNPVSDILIKTTIEKYSYQSTVDSVISILNATN